jgi:transposase
VAHRRAKLTPYGRSVLVDRVLVQGWSVREAAKAASVSPATVYKWLARFGDEGSAGLQDRSSAPRRRPRALPPSQVRTILAGRRRLKVGPHRLGPMLGHPRSTVCGVLRRAGLSRLAHLDRPSGGTPSL